MCKCFDIKPGNMLDEPLAIDQLKGTIDEKPILTLCTAMGRKGTGEYELMVDLWSGEDTTVFMQTIKLKYCPFCGQKLES